jgi:diaminohydroxyphosphoribosylaminopyrimidine deaminase/5-amino-6-(5-phosphoribosylamino)uracil reductase
VSRWDAYMRQALDLAVSPDAPRGENPRVGCVLVDATGTVVGAGYHRGAGTPHAEVVALEAAHGRTLGATAVVTLEPCRHVGRTGPCTEALISAGISRVVFAQPDPTALAGGGAANLADAGIEVIGGVCADDALEVNRAWTHVQVTGRPLVTLKCAMSLDGRVAGPGGEPIAITGPAARALSHRLRSEVDAIAVGTGTALVDDPHLTARDAEGRPVARQPLRVIVGEREIPSSLHVLDDAAASLHLRTRSPREVVEALRDRGVHHLLIEGGPTLATAFLEAGLVDEVMWFIAPRLLGSGPISLARLTHPVPVVVSAVESIGDDVLIRGRIRP